jgi:hypothetical protein
MPYDNKELCRILNDKQQTLRMAAAFLDQMRKEMTAHEDLDFVKLYGNISEMHVTREINIVWATAESAIERIFISSLIMNFIRNHDPLGLVITHAMADAEHDMEDLRDSIRRLKAGMHIRECQGQDMSPDALFRDLEEAFQSGQLDEWQHDLNMHMLWCYHFFPLETALHVTPQATFPKLLSDGRGARADMLCWIPEHPSFQIIVECDSYQHHDSKRAFDSDRRRSRAFQRKSFRVLQYSGGEIWRDPIRTSYELHDHLTTELQQFIEATEANT